MQVQIETNEKTLIKRAVALIRRGQHLEALDRFVHILEDNPKALSQILLPLYKHIKHHDKDNQLRIVIAQLYMFTNRHKEAVFECEECIEEDPYFTQSYYLLRKIYNKNFLADDIFKLFETAFENEIYDSAIIDTLPTVYLETNNTKKSIHFFETLLKQFPNNLHYYKTLASIYKKTRQYDHAIDILEEMVKQSPDLASEAAKQCESMSKTDPMNKKIRNALINLYLQSCQPDHACTHIQDLILMDPSTISKAIETYRLALDSYPGTQSVLMSLAKALIQINEYTEAIQHLQLVSETSSEKNTVIIPILEKILDQQNNQSLALELLSKIFVAEKSYSQALPHLETLSQIFPPPEAIIENLTIQIKEADSDLANRAQLILAKTYASLKQKEKCKNAIHSLIDTPYHCDARLIEISLLETENNLKDAISDLHLLMKQYPENAALHKKLKKLKKEHALETIKELEKDKHPNVYNIGQAYLQIGYIYEALENFQKLSPSDEAYAHCHLLIARCFLELGRYDMTINQLTRTLEYLPEKSSNTANQARFLMSINYLYQGATKSAIQELEKIQEYDIHFPKVSELLDLLKEQSLLDLRGKAIAACKQSDSDTITLITIPNFEESQADPQHQKISFAHPHNNQGVDYLLKQNPTNADAEFSLAIQMDPSLTIAHCNLAIQKAQKKEFDSAQALLNTAEGINSNCDSIFLNRSFIYHLDHKYELAIENAQKALKINPNNMLANVHIGDIYYEQDRIKLAFEYWKKAAKKGLLPHLIHRRITYLYDSPPENLDWISSKTDDLSDLIPGL
jgi:tetratricopeptide (TPR) repeat protein